MRMVFAHTLAQIHNFRTATCVKHWTRGNHIPLILTTRHAFSCFLNPTLLTFIHVDAQTFSPRRSFGHPPTPPTISLPPITIHSLTHSLNYFDGLAPTHSFSRSRSIDPFTYSRLPPCMCIHVRCYGNFALLLQHMPHVTHP